jgi:hypothetical protein
MPAVLVRIIAAMAPGAAATSVLASQGPGVGPGSASPLLQSVVALFVAGLGAIVVVGLVLMLLGGRPRD